MLSNYFIAAVKSSVFYDAHNKAGINIDCGFLHAYKSVP